MNAQSKECNKKMNRETFKEIVTTIHKAIYPGDDIDADLFCDGSKFSKVFCNIDIVDYKIEEVDQYGGEDCGDDIWYVFKLTMPDGNICHVKFEGKYNSWDDSSFWGDEFFLVEPIEKVVVFYKYV